MENVIYFLILPKSNSNFNIGTVNLSSCTKSVIKLKVCFYERYSSLFIRTSAFICLHSSFLFQYGKKSMSIYITYTSTCFWYCRKHLKNDNKIWLLSFSVALALSWLILSNLIQFSSGEILMNTITNELQQNQ